MLRSGTGLTQKTSSQFITIHYPFHPLAGQRFRPLCVNEKPRPSFRIQLPELRLTIPAWMTEPEAAKCQLCAAPRVVVDALLKLADLVEDARASLRPGPGKMRKDSATGGDRIDGPKTEATTSRGGGRGRSTASPSAGPGAGSHGEAAATSAARGRQTGSWSRGTKEGEER